MKIIVPILLYLISFYPITYAVEKIPQNLIQFDSPKGLQLLKNNLTPNTLKLLDHFTAQQTLTYCGIASSVIILNSSNIPAPLAFPNATFRYFTQDNIFNEQVEKIVPKSVILKEGLTLTQLSKILGSYGLNVKKYFSNSVDKEKFRALTKDAIMNNKFVLVNFLSTGLKQTGGGHISPLAAYDAATDRFLLLDVSRYKYPSYWVKTDDIWNGIHTLDGDNYRGFLIISNK